MSLDQKYRVREVAKDFVLKGKPVGSKKVMELLGKYAHTPSSTSAALTDAELSLVFEALTQSNPATLADVFSETYQEKKPEPKAADTWDCPNCGNKGITAKFCGECGFKKPEAPAAWDCPNCGNKGITAKFCGECGFKKPETPATWDCPECGTLGITAKFCPECGTKKP
jgi:ribosomal protein L32